jgi:hypothetical protein
LTANTFTGVQTVQRTGISDNFVSLFTMNNTDTKSAAAVYGAASSSTQATSGTTTMYGLEGSTSKGGQADTANMVMKAVSGVATYQPAGGMGSGETANVYGGYFSATGDAFGESAAYGVYATANGADNNYAGYFNGNVVITGSLTQTTAKSYLWIPAGGITPDTCSALLVGDSDPNVWDYLAFDGATDEYGTFTISPADWDLGTIKAKFVWAASAAMTDAHTVIWGLNCYAVSDGDTMDVAYDTGAQTASDAYATSDETGPIKKITAATSALTVQGTPAAGDVVHCRVYRDADADTSTIDAWLLGVKIEYGKGVQAAW